MALKLLAATNKSLERSQKAARSTQVVRELPPNKLPNHTAQPSPDSDRDEAEKEETADDGWHFVKCPECNGTGKRPATKPLEESDGKETNQKTT